MDIPKRAEELAESIVNGNWSWVAEALATTTPTAKAVALAVNVSLHLASDDRITLARILRERADTAPHKRPRRRLPTRQEMPL